MNIYSAMVSLNLDNTITVSMTHSFEAFRSSLPPPSGSLMKNIGLHEATLGFLSTMHVPFLVNLYLYIGYKGN